MKYFILGVFLFFTACSEEVNKNIVGCKNNEIKTTDCGLNKNGILNQVCRNNVWENEGICTDDDICLNGTVNEIQCGINNAGIIYDVCQNGNWIHVTNCLGDDICEEYSSQIISCGINENGKQNQICTNGNWINSEECNDDDVCLNNSSQITNCGLNNTGNQEQKCENGIWINSGNCINVDVCENDSERDILCGLNNTGIQHQKCENGIWINNGVCNESDVCENETTRILENICGLNNTGIQQQKCENGIWINNGNCIDNDICVNNEFQIVENICGFNNNGNIEQICLNGKWENNSECNDDDICLNGTTSYTYCGFNNNGHKQQNCVNGNWESNENCIISKREYQYGSSFIDEAKSLASDSFGNIYITGATYGTIGQQNYGLNDIFLTKINMFGEIEWNRQLGTVGWDSGDSISIDDENFIYITGIIHGDLDGNENGGGICNLGFPCSDMFLAKYNSIGEKIWTKQWGTDTNDSARYIVNKDEFIYITGITNSNFGDEYFGQTDVFIMKLTKDGEILWKKQFGTSQNDYASAFTVDSENNIYMSLITDGNFEGFENSGSFDIVLLKINNEGNIIFTKQFGTDNEERVSGIVILNENLFISGHTKGSFTEEPNLGDFDIFLLKTDLNGELIHITQLGTPEKDEVNAIKIHNENIYLAGNTTGDLNSNISTGLTDIYLVKLDSNENILWVKQWGTDNEDVIGNSIIFDNLSNIFIGGRTLGSTTGNSNLGNWDTFLTKWFSEWLDL